MTNKLEHWEEECAAYFVTWRLRRGLPALSTEERGTVVDALRYFTGQRYDLLGYVVMNDHVHVVFQANAEFSLDRIVRSWKSYTAHRLQESTRDVAASGKMVTSSVSCATKKR